jgi:hypothetical protein
MKRFPACNQAPGPDDGSSPEASRPQGTGVPPPDAPHPVMQRPFRGEGRWKGSSSRPRGARKAGASGSPVRQSSEDERQQGDGGHSPEWTSCRMRARTTFISDSSVTTMSPWLVPEGESSRGDPQVPSGPRAPPRARKRNSALILP